MKKIRLELETLSVESFDTTAAPDGRGTVQGHVPPETYWRYCSDGITCVDSCDASCNATECDATCVTHCASCYSGCETCYEWTCDPDCCCTCSCY